MKLSSPISKFNVIEHSPSFVFGRLDLNQAFDVHNSILREVDTNYFEEGLVADDDSPDFEYRQCDIYWLKKSAKAKTIAHSLVKKVNNKYFQIPIDNHYPPEHQYTVYRDLEDHYDWHQDHYDDDDTDANKDFIRTLSLSICLTPSDWYEGAEFFIKDGAERNVRTFKMRYGDFIIFPSNVEHKVNALRSGERESLVIWYGLTQ